jgi:hypothetical protein
VRRHPRAWAAVEEPRQRRVALSTVIMACAESTIRIPLIPVPWKSPGLVLRGCDVGESDQVPSAPGRVIQPQQQVEQFSVRLTERVGQAIPTKRATWTHRPDNGPITASGLRFYPLTPVSYRVARRWKQTVTIRRSCVSFTSREWPIVG